jgi:hypothetical protein
MPSTRSGEYYAFQTRPGISLDDQLTNGAVGMGMALGANTQVDVESTSGVAVAATPKVAASIWITLTVVVGLLVVMKFAIEHEKSGMQPALMGIGVWNWVAVTIMATLGIVTEKALLNKYNYIPGLTEYVNAA